MVQGAPFTLTIFALGAMKLLIISLVGFISSSAAGRNDRIWAAGIVDKLLSGLTTDVSETVPQMIAANHYNVEIHHVTTEDGYILEMHRIPASPTRPAAHGKPVVFLMHGLLSSSADWVLVGPGKSFSYILTDLGYDVWMGNARGNTYSRNHTTLSPSSSKFWQFSFHEIGIYDLPIMIDYVLKTTGLKKIIYVGHSQGTTSFYVMASEKTEYNAKIKAMFSLAPVAYTNHLFSPIFRLIATFVNNSLEFFTRFGVNEILPRNRLLSVVGATLCNDNGISHVLCVNGMFIMYGFNTAQLNTTLLPIIARHTPAGGSIRQVAHYGQGIESGKFRQYDYDYMENKLKYGSSMPPDYNLRLVTAPVHLTYSVNDWISSPTDVVRLYNELGNPIEMVKVDDDKWNHLDYYWGINAKEFVYDPILATLNARYSD